MNDSAHSNEISKEQLEQLINQARSASSSEQALTTLYNTYFQRIYRFIFYRVSHKETAEDLTEEVFLKTFSNLHKLEQTQAFEGWMFQIARNLVIDYYRSKKATVALEEVEHSLEYESNVIDLVNLQTEQQVFLKLLAELTDEQQQVLKLKFYEEVPNDAIAKLLNKTEGAIRVIQHRAIAKLKELLEQLKDNNSSKLDNK